MRLELWCASLTVGECDRRRRLMATQPSFSMRGHCPRTQFTQEWHQLPQSFNSSISSRRSEPDNKTSRVRRSFETNTSVYVLRVGTTEFSFADNTVVRESRRRSVCSVRTKPRDLDGVDRRGGPAQAPPSRAHGREQDGDDGGGRRLPVHCRRLQVCWTGRMG